MRGAAPGASTCRGEVLGVRAEVDPAALPPLPVADEVPAPADAAAAAMRGALGVTGAAGGNAFGELFACALPIGGITTSASPTEEVVDGPAVCPADGVVGAVGVDGADGATVAAGASCFGAAGAAGADAARAVVVALVAELAGALVAALAAVIGAETDSCAIVTSA